MTEQAVADWMLANLDPSVGPLFLGFVAHWDTARPALIALFASVVAFEGVVLWGVWRYLTR